MKMMWLERIENTHLIRNILGDDASIGLSRIINALVERIEYVKITLSPNVMAKKMPLKW